MWCYCMILFVVHVNFLILSFFFPEGYGVLLYVDLFGIENGFVPRTPFFLGNPVLCSSCEHCAPSGALTLANLFHMKRLQAYDILTWPSRWNPQHCSRMTAGYRPKQIRTHIIFEAIPNHHHLIRFDLPSWADMQQRTWVWFIRTEFPAQCWREFQL